MPVSAAHISLEDQLLRQSLLQERLASVLFRNPKALAPLLRSALRSKADFAECLRANARITARGLAYNSKLVDWVREQRRAGVPVALVARPGETIATEIAGHLGIFDEVLSGESASMTPVTLDRPRLWKAIPKALRVHQWTKNFLIFVPLLTSHRLFEIPQLLAACVAFVAFSCCASAIYILNDLIDLPNDRAHERKRFRPLASGALPISWGIAAMFVLLAGSLALTSLLPGSFGFMLALYLVTTVAYSSRLKRMLLVDVFTLAALYILRVLAGSAATNVPSSAWLLSFSGFVFFSLALAKRVSELGNLNKAQRANAPGRGYFTADLSQLSTFGVASAFAASVVLSLYISSPRSVVLYHQPGFLWLLCPVYLYWMLRLWMIAHRGHLDEDPITFAARDGVTRYIVALVIAIMSLAALWRGPFPSAFEN